MGSKLFMTENVFKISFHGVRGSIPSPLIPEEVEEKLLRACQKAQPEDLKDEKSISDFVSNLPNEIKGTFGGNSSCVSMEVNGERLIFDAGSGIRMLGQDLMDSEFGRGQGKANIFFSHTHWDHIMGIPFFVPFYIKGNQFTINSPLLDIRDRIEGQQKSEYFPIPFSIYDADIDFEVLANRTERKIGDLKVTWKSMYHPGQCYAYRVDCGGKSVVYATDAEYKKFGSGDLKPYVEFFKDADLLIFDSMYTFSEGLEKEDWGHSSTFIGVDLAVKANVNQIAFFHHEPTYSDFKLADIFKQTEKYLKLIAPKQELKMLLSYEGLTIDLHQ
jgi:phosphoribosyl 1,2-cyclic phosphodiesterase